MSYILLLITLASGSAHVKHVGTYSTMANCFDAREQIVEQLGRPIVNYQAVCVLHTEDSVTVPHSEEVLVSHTA